jgi:hypothetical protein
MAVRYLGFSTYVLQKMEEQLFVACNNVPSPAQICIKVLECKTSDFALSVCPLNMDILLQREQLGIPQTDSYLDQNEINSDNRTLLLDWLQGVVYNEGVKERNTTGKITFTVIHRMQYDIYFLMVSILDRFIKSTDILLTVQDLQGVGIAALWIAIKFCDCLHENLYMKISDNPDDPGTRVADWSAGYYTQAQIAHVEREILNGLKHDIYAATSHDFLVEFISGGDEQRFSRYKPIYRRSIYILQMFSLTLDYWRWKPSEVAAASLLIATYKQQTDFDLKSVLIRFDINNILNCCYNIREIHHMYNFALGPFAQDGLQMTLINIGKEKHDIVSYGYIDERLREAHNLPPPSCFATPINRKKRSFQPALPFKSALNGIFDNHSSKIFKHSEAASAAV